MIAYYHKHREHMHHLKLCPRCSGNCRRKPGGGSNGESIFFLFELLRLRETLRSLLFSYALIQMS